MTSDLVIRNRGLFLWAIVAAWAPTTANAQPPAPLVTGLKNPQAVAVSADGPVSVLRNGTVLGRSTEDD